MERVNINGKYRLTEYIAGGGMSDVYLAEEIKTGDIYAVKVINREGGNVKELINLKHIIEYTEKLKKLNHPSIVAFKEVIDCGYTVYIVMEYVKGISLDKVTEQYGAVQEEKVLKWSAELADALNYLHSQKPPVIYRDMKPSNVMLEDDGTVKIIDFDISREEKKGQGDTTILGTRGYAPPEQYSGKTDRRSDIYALGMTMYHLITGTMPDSWESCVRPSIINPLVSDGTEAIILKATDPDPDKRYQNCDEMLYDILHPENAGKEYRKEIRRKLNLFTVTLILTCLFSLLSAGCFVYGRISDNNAYEILTARVNSSQSYIYAAYIYPGKADAYLKLLETYEERGSFGHKESNEFLRLYNSKKEYMKRNDSRIAYLNYKAGLMYFNYYEGESFSEKILKAYPFFRENHENMKHLKDFPERNLSEAYYEICSFYKTYILKSSSVSEADFNDYSGLINTLKSTDKNIGNAEAYDRLVLYNSIFMFVYSERHNLASVNYDYESLISFLDHIYEEVKETDVRKEQSLKLKEEVQQNYVLYRDAVKKAYGRKE